MCVFPTAKVQVYGSFAYGTCSPTSAIDIRCEKCYEINSLLPKYSGSLKNQGFRVVNTMSNSETSGFLQIEHLELKITANIVLTSPGSETDTFTNMIKDMLAEHPEAVHVHAVLRHVLSQVRCGDVSTGGLPSIALLLMVVRACKAVAPSRDNGDILHWFLQEYGADFDYQNCCIAATSVRPLPKPSAVDPIFIADPTDPSNNLAANCTKITQIKSQFLYCQMALLKWTPGQSGRKGYKGRTPLSTLISHQTLWDRVDNSERVEEETVNANIAQVKQPGGVQAPRHRPFSRRTESSVTTDESTHWTPLGRSSLTSSIDELASLFDNSFGPSPSLHHDPAWVWDMATESNSTQRRMTMLSELIGEEESNYDAQSTR
eukprot:TRINITY_DN1570_c0_g1_i1.p1 TRINITY_DN1570_c0_g1~~TRINITY_DN1570_c0_g1_i1.p1  ORF type:complete len:375 (+),score=27.29 TRINITY_DN1570_c0_g1_i1:346-1470(+)